MRKLFSRDQYIRRKRHQVVLYDLVLAKERYENRHIDHHIEFFRSGLNAIIRKWLFAGCPETPAEMMEILRSEYTGRME